MATKRDNAKKLASAGSKKIAEGRKLQKAAKLLAARAPAPSRGGQRDGSGREEKGAEERRVQESFQLLPSTVEALDQWAEQKTATQGKKVSSRVLVEASVRRALGLPISEQDAALLAEKEAA